MRTLANGEDPKMSHYVTCVVSKDEKEYNGLMVDTKMNKTYCYCFLTSAEQKR